MNGTSLYKMITVTGFMLLCTFAGAQNKLASASADSTGVTAPAVTPVLSAGEVDPAANQSTAPEPKMAAGAQDTPAAPQQSPATGPVDDRKKPK